MQAGNEVEEIEYLFASSNAKLESNSTFVGGMCNVYRNTGPNLTIIADGIQVNGGAVIFIVNGKVTYVFPPGQYLYVAKI